MDDRSDRNAVKLAGERCGRANLSLRHPVRRIDSEAKSPLWRGVGLSSFWVPSAVVVLAIALTVSFLIG